MAVDETSCLGTEPGVRSARLPPLLVSRDGPRGARRFRRMPRDREVHVRVARPTRLVPPRRSLAECFGARANWSDLIGAGGLRCGSRSRWQVIGFACRAPPGRRAPRTSSSSSMSREPPRSGAGQSLLDAASETGRVCGCRGQSRARASTAQRVRADGAPDHRSPAPRCGNPDAARDRCTDRSRAARRRPLAPSR